jgi:hypothetical protein
MRSRRTREEEANRARFVRYRGPSMTLGNMRENGVRHLAVYCRADVRPPHGVHAMRRDRRRGKAELERPAGVVDGPI